MLALAQIRLPSWKRDLVHADIEHGMTLLGCVAMIDPPRDEVRDPGGDRCRPSMLYMLR